MNTEPKILGSWLSVAKVVREENKERVTYMLDFIENKRYAMRHDSGLRLRSLHGMCLTTARLTIKIDGSCFSKSEHVIDLQTYHSGLRELRV